MSGVRRRPVARWKIAAGGVAMLVVLIGIIAGAETLRHPGPGDEGDPGDGGDPRIEVRCEDPMPREGQERQDAEPGPAVDISSGELYDCPQTYDGRLVRYRGEVVGATLERSDGVWVQMNDDIYAEAHGPLPSHRVFRGGNAGLGVFLPPEVAEEIMHVGGPNHHGDVIEVTGTFHRVDPVSTEVVVIRATSATIVQHGGRTEDPPLTDRRLVALILVPLALAITIVDRRAALRS